MKFLQQTILFTLFFLLTPFFIYSQKCNTTIHRQQQLQKYPDRNQQIQEINRQTQHWIRTHKSSSKSRSIVPLNVVVHVLWKTEEENISAEQIQSQIDVLNKDFNLQNDNFFLTPSPFQSLAANVDIQFQLARVDPNGNPTNGITRTKTDVEQIGQTDFWYADATGGKDAWDNSRYINIWVCDIGDDFLGFASLPGTANEDDGLVIGHNYFGTTGTAANSFPNHLGRTGTHEMGHYFNLEHVWGVNGGCEEDDLVADTPNQFRASSECPSFPEYDFCTTDGDGVNFNNFMDYSDDECLTMFTEGQKMRMLAALNGPRASLLNTGSPCPPAGQNCDDRNPNTIEDKTDGNCNCLGMLCPPVGTSCNDGLASTSNDQYDDNCNCQGTACPAIGTACDDGISITENDVEDGNCNCAGTLCPPPGADCNDGNPNTTDDRTDGQCNCIGTPINCLPANTPCNDSNPLTENDVEDGSCNCVGTAVTCPPPNTACNDNNPSTTNDIEDGSCNCVGTPCPIAGTSCNDNNVSTTNDIEDGQCNCIGTPCPIAGTSCNDGNSLTENDVEDGQCNCRGIVPSTTPTEDNDPLMENYPFLDDLIIDCSETTVTIYQSGIYKYLLVETANSSVLYNEAGQLYCTSTPTYDCISIYNLREVASVWDCVSGSMQMEENQASAPIFDLYPWLLGTIDPNTCPGEVRVYQSGVYSFVWVAQENSTILYNAQGQQYCVSTENYDCLSLYNLTTLTDAWNCNSGNIIQTDPNPINLKNHSSPDAEQIQVYPNPSNGQVYLDWSLHQEAPKSVQLLNTQGQILQTFFYNSQEEVSSSVLNLSDQAAGLYFIQFTFEQGTSIKRIFIQ